jgi:formylglycine-generating enzyme required for sulfatase activity
MVLVASPVQSFCIDAHEVTRKEYLKFTGTNPKAQVDPPKVCDWNMNYAPSDGTGADDDPVLGVDWCDAYAYCAYAGKRLCGGKGGAPVGDAGWRVDPTDEWYFACSAGGQLAYPYGPNVDLTLCSDCDPNAGCSPGTATPSPVGSKPKCTGGVPGLFDMSGNAWEWENECEPAVDAGPDAGPDLDTCSRRGGSYDLPRLGKKSVCLSCGVDCGNGPGTTSPTRNSHSQENGIRCCADPH